MFSKDITIINKAYIDGATKYFKTPLKGFWSNSNGITLNGTNLVKSDGLVCRILMSNDGYVEPSLFNGTGWTLRPDDYIVKGLIEEDITSITTIKDNYECMKITKVSKKDYGSENMWHFEIDGE